MVRAANPQKKRKLMLGARSSTCVALTVVSPVLVLILE
jgi:hypothetical protein